MVINPEPTVSVGNGQITLFRVSGNCSSLSATCPPWDTVSHRLEVHIHGSGPPMKMGDFRTGAATEGRHVHLCSGLVIANDPIGIAWGVDEGLTPRG